MQFKILGSSSSGNSALIVTDESKILIDAGFSCRRLTHMLADAGVKLEHINAVFLTHEHGDHATGLKGMSRQPDVPVYANRDTAQAVQKGIKRRLNWKLFETGSSFRFRDLEVSTFSIPHDAYDPVGYVIRNGGNDLFNPTTSIAWVTDLGYIPTLVQERVRDVDLLVIEANHDLNLLEEDEKRPWSVKQRIRGRHGHLSNQAVFEFLSGEKKARWQQVFLAHLSKDCNCTKLVRETFDHSDLNFAISVIDPYDGDTPMIDLNSIRGQSHL